MRSQFIKKKVASFFGRLFSCGINSFLLWIPHILHFTSFFSFPIAQSPEAFALSLSVLFQDSWQASFCSVLLPIFSLASGYWGICGQITENLFSYDNSLPEANLPHIIMHPQTWGAKEHRSTVQREVARKWAKTVASIHETMIAASQGPLKGLECVREQHWLFCYFCHSPPSRLPLQRRLPPAILQQLWLFCCVSLNHCVWPGPFSRHCWKDLQYQSMRWA